MKSFIAAILSFFMMLSSLFGLADKETAEKIQRFLNSSDNVSVIVELEEGGLLDSVKNSEERKELLS